jgi:hypothetical protein
MDAHNTLVGLLRETETFWKERQCCGSLLCEICDLYEYVFVRGKWGISVGLVQLLPMSPQ